MMKAYDQLNFLSYVSKKAGKPIALVSAVSEDIEACGRIFEKKFCMLDGDLLDELRNGGVAFVEFDTLDEAKRIMGMMEYASRQIPDIGLYAVLFADGVTISGISQKKCQAIVEGDARIAL